MTQSLSKLRKELQKKPYQWLIYYHHGEIKVKRGWVKGQCFYPEDDKYRWQAKIPRDPLTITSRGKVYVNNEADIEKAVVMVRVRYLEQTKKYMELCKKRIKNIKTGATK